MSQGWLSPTSLVDLPVELLGAILDPTTFGFLELDLIALVCTRFRAGARLFQTYLLPAETTIEEYRHAFQSLAHCGPNYHWNIKCCLLKQLFKNKHLRSDRVFAHAAVRTGGYALKWISPDICDRDLVLAAVTSCAANCYAALQLAPIKFRADRQVMLAAVACDGQALQLASPALCRDREIVIAAVTSMGPVLEYAHFTLRADREVMLAAVTDCAEILELAHPTILADREVVLRAVASCGEVLALASPALQADREVVLLAVSRSGAAASQFAAPALQSDPEVIAALQRFENII